MDSQEGFLEFELVWEDLELSIQRKALWGLRGREEEFGMEECGIFLFFGDGAIEEELVIEENE